MEKTKKTENRPPTVRQRRAAKAIIENRLLDKPKSEGEILENVGYSNGISLTPSMVTQSSGFKKALAEFGLTEELITTSLVEDIKAKPKSRVKELGLGADILGMRKREEESPKNNSISTYNFIFSKEVQNDVKKLEESIKEKLMKHVQKN